MLATLKSVFGRQGLMSSTPHRVARIERNEGGRGYSTRAAVYLRHAAYFAIIVIGSAITHYAFAATGPHEIDGGLVMFFLTSLMLVIGAAATMFYTNHRNDILDQVRHYTFGLMVLPGTVIALIMWAVQGMVDSQVNPDAFSRTISTGLIMVYGATLLIPPVIFVKLMAGIRTMHRSTLDDQEMMQLWTRQDGKQQ
jgi:hypothetical protein